MVRDAGSAGYSGYPQRFFSQASHEPFFTVAAGPAPSVASVASISSVGGLYGAGGSDLEGKVVHVFASAPSCNSRSRDIIEDLDWPDADDTVAVPSVLVGRWDGEDVCDDVPD